MRYKKQINGNKKMNKIAKITTLTTASALLISLSGCTAMSTMIKHRNLATESKMSNSIMLPPLSPDEKTIFVQVKDTTSYDFDQLKTDLVSDLQKSGFHYCR